MAPEDARVDIASMPGSTTVSVGDIASQAEVVVGEAIGHRLWVISTRSLSSDACRANLDTPSFRVWRLDACGSYHQSSLDEFFANRVSGGPLVVQVHGNRMEFDDAIERGLFVYHKTMPHASVSSLDYVLFSWPSEKEGLLVNDGREKADRTDAEGLYLAWLLRQCLSQSGNICVVGYSFGGRVATGAAHALAGGSLGGRQLPGEPVQGANLRMGLIAPALEDSWLQPGNYHGLASQNIERMTILYNRRDAVLKRYWLLDQVRGRMALGFTGPRGIGPRVDGSPMEVHSCDCSLSLGIYHDEKKYYTESCQAGRQMAKLIKTLE